MPPFFAWFLTPIGRKVGFAVLVLLLLTGMYFVAYERGHSSGYNSGKGDGEKVVFDQSRQQSEQEHATFQKVLDTFQSRDAAAQQMVQAALSVVSQVNGQLVALQANRKQEQVKVEALPDSSLFSDIRFRLNVDRLNTTTNFTYPELRKIDSTVADYDGIKQENDLLTTKVDALGKETVGMQDRIDSRDVALQGAINYGNLMYSNYTQLWNLHPPKRRSVKCLWIWNCVADKLPVPAPAQLKPNWSSK